MSQAATIQDGLIFRGRRRRQQGLVAVEFALLWIGGVLPLLLLATVAVSLFSIKQTLTLAAENGARAMLSYQPSMEARRQYACNVAQQATQWLQNYAGIGDVCQNTASTAGTTTGIAVSQPFACPYKTSSTGTSFYCVTVTASYNYAKNPFFPGTASLYGWIVSDSISSTATVQLDAGI